MSELPTVITIGKTNLKRFGFIFCFLMIGFSCLFESNCLHKGKLI